MKIVTQEVTCLTPKSYVKELPTLIEKCGRTCYQSESEYTHGTAIAFIAKLIDNGHESALEHGTLTFRFICNRGTSHQLVRHRHCSFSQESTRYVKYDELTFIKPEGYPTIVSTDHIDRIYSAWRTIEGCYQLMKDENQEYSRSILPIGIKTELVMTTNIREWRSILKLRTTAHAHPQTRALALSLMNWFEYNLPVMTRGIDV